MILFLIIMFSLSLYFNKIIFFAFLLPLTIVLLIFTVVYCFYTFILIRRLKKVWEKSFILPLETVDSNLEFSCDLHFFFFSFYKLILISDKQKIQFIYRDKKFVVIPFLMGIHHIKKFELKFHDPFFMIPVKINFPVKMIYNLFSIPGSSNSIEKEFEENDLSTTQKKAISSPDLIRNYVQGDDPRKILWRAYALFDELKYRDLWLETSEKKSISIGFAGFEVEGNQTKEYLILQEYILKKCFVFLKMLLNNNLMIEFDQNFYQSADIPVLQKVIFDSLISDNLHPEKLDLVFISALDTKSSIAQKAVQSLSSKSILLETGDFFLQDSDNTDGQGSKKKIRDLIMQNRDTKLKIIYNNSQIKGLENAYKKKIPHFL